MESLGSQPARERTLAESPKKLSPARLRRLARSLARRRVAMFLARQPTYLMAGPVRLGRDVVGWEAVEWEGENQAHVGSIFHGSVHVGLGTHFGAFSFISGNVTVGRYGSYGPRVSLISHDRHPMETAALYVSTPLPRPSTRPGEGWRTAGELRIGHDVWIGAGAAILGAVSVGNGAVIAANSVVTSDVAPFTIVGGTPARLIRPRFDPEITDLLEQWAWWNLDTAEIKANGELIDMDLIKSPQDSVRLLKAAIDRRRD